MPSHSSAALRRSWASSIAPPIVRRTLPPPRARPPTRRLTTCSRKRAPTSCTSARLRRRITRRRATSLERGAHVYVEKPFALTTRDARALLELARSKGLLISAGHQLLRDPAFETLMARAGELGSIVQIDSHFAFRPVGALGERAGRARLAEQAIDVLPHPLYTLVAALEQFSRRASRLTLAWTHAGPQTFMPFSAPARRRPSLDQPARPPCCVDADARRHLRLAHMRFRALDRRRRRQSRHGSARENLEPDYRGGTARRTHDVEPVPPASPRRLSRARRAHRSVLRDPSPTATRRRCLQNISRA